MAHEGDFMEKTFTWSLGLKNYDILAYEVLFSELHMMGGISEPGDPFT